jgi:hypothetical protein
MMKKIWTFSFSDQMGTGDKFGAIVRLLEGWHTLL